MNFKTLHQQDTPLIICNVWDVKTALLAESLNVQAIATSSAAIANSLGYEDGEDMSFDELFFIVEKIAKRTALPLSVDIESGYSRNPADILANIEKLHAVGVKGINIEDSTVNNGTRSLLPTSEFVELLSTLKQGIIDKNLDIFVNVRTDPFLIGVPDALSSAIARITAYQTVDIDGIFVPCAVEHADIQLLVNCTSLPLNLLAMPDMCDFVQLQSLGVKRLSMGNWLFEKLANSYQENVSQILKSQNFSALF
ncbi:carboxyvinyl-carboxyphosphonate phosphorylmutase [Thalassotalea insulae]|uniref:Carboxyvinyl-carboxyphosphonate phosphorylmutase n=1 Tax=Thalassotalea insulae TaxID=2056778 RepID=A0ABQ6GRW0_9GAMM|nr:isocitrate lyase/phosphoenolpyruvate mutase family protein [Thalassotalea insulae]GLX78678.1 carboxyvinyl-carboxyphosphonate phosphorylmutase [Thalassotalea insulae]